MPRAPTASEENEAGNIFSTGNRWHTCALDGRLRRGWNADRNAHINTAESHDHVEREGRRRNRESRLEFRVTNNDGGGGRGPRRKFARFVE